MNPLPTEWRIPKAPPADDRWALIERIVASHLLHRAPQLRDILVYVAARSLTESPVTITEQEIGAIVLKRGPDFDPGHDNIVRAQMRHLRMKLEVYFSREGSREPFIVTIPKGHYLTRFEPSPFAAAGVEEASGDTGKPAQPPAGQRSASVRWAVPALAAVVATTALTLLFQSYRAKSPTVHAAYSIYEDVLGPVHDETNQGTWLVLCDPHAGLSSRTEPRNEVRNEAPSSPVSREGFHPGPGHAAASFHFGQLMQILDRRTKVLHARFLNWELARERVLIILGSPETNEWIGGNTPNHNFTIVAEGIRNRQPKPGEPDLYPVTRDAAGVAVADYGLIWAWKNPAGSHVLLLAGPSAASTEAAAFLFANVERFRPIYERLKHDAGGREFPTNWQVVMQVDIRDSLPIKTAYVTHRIYGQQP